MTGRIMMVEERPFGTTLETEALSTDTELVVEDVSDFDGDGGVLAIGELTAQYTTIDEDTNTIVLAAELGAAVDAEESVFVHPYSTERVAHVISSDDQDDEEPMEARIPHALYDRIDVGAREAASGEAVELDYMGDELVITDVLGSEPLVSGTFLDPDTLPQLPTSDGNPPAISPPAVVLGGIRSLFVTWNPIANADPITYEVHVSTSSGFTPEPATYAGEVRGTMFVIRTLPGTTDPPAYGTTYFVRVVARDVDGSAAAGTEGSGTPEQAGTIDLLDLAVTGQKIADTAVGEDKLADISVTAQKIADTAVTAKKMAIGDFDNLVQDPGFELDGLGWEVETGWELETNLADVFHGLRAFRFTGGTAALRNAVEVPCKLGDKFYVSGWLRGTVGADGLAAVRVVWRDAAHVDISATEFFVGGAGDGTWHNPQGIAEAPSGTAYARAEFVVYGRTAGTWYADNIMMRRAVTGELVVDGSIKAAHIDAGAVTADKIAARAVTAEKMAIGNFDNVAQDPGFELGGVGWVLQTGFAVVEDDTLARTGDYSLAFTGGTAAARNAVHAECAEGDKFYIEGYVRGDGGADGTATVRVSWLDVSRAEIGSAMGGPPAPSDGEYHRCNGILTAPAGAVFARAEFVVLDRTTGTWRGDDILLRQAMTGELVVEGSIKTANLEALSVTADKLAANAVTADKILANEIQAEHLAALIVLASTIMTAPEGSRIEIDAAGIRCYRHNETLCFNLPTGELEDPFFEGVLSVLGLNASGPAVFNSPDNLLGQGAALSLGAQLQPPGSAPALAISHETMNLIQSPNETAQGRSHIAYDPNGGPGQDTPVFWVIESHMSRGSYRLDEYRVSDGVQLRSFYHSTNSWVNDGITVMGDHLYFLRTDFSFTKSILFKYDKDTLTQVAQYDINHISGPFGYPVALGNNGTELLMVFERQNASGDILQPSIRRYNDTGGFIAGTVTSGIPLGSIWSHWTGILEHDGLWWISVQNRGGSGPFQGVRAVNTSGVYQANRIFQTSGSFEGGAFGVVHDGTRFWTLHHMNGPTVVKHTDWDWTTESSVYWLGYTWAHSDGWSTTISPRANFNMGNYRRTRLGVTIPPMPSEANRVRVYAERSASAPATTALKRQAAPDYILSETAVPTRMVDFDSGGAAPPTSNGAPGGTSAVIQPLGTPGWKLSGDGKFVTPLRCIVSKASGQTIAAGSEVVVNWPVEEYKSADGTAMHDNSTNNPRLIAPRAGYYRVDADIVWDAPATSPSRRILVIRKNGTTQVFKDRSQVSGTGAGTWGHSGGRDIVLAAGDYLEILVEHSEGGTYQVQASSTASLRLISDT